MGCRERGIQGTCPALRPAARGVTAEVAPLVLVSCLRPALAGIHYFANQDLDEARRLAEKLPAADRSAPPGWVAPIDALCRYASDQLAKASHGPDAELAALLRLLTLEQPPRTDVALRGPCGDRCQSQCFRAHDALCEVNGVANLHVATTMAPEVLSKNVPRRIAAIPGLPEAARKAAERLDEVAMTRALDDASVPAGDPVEPSWGALAKMVRETDSPSPAAGWIS